MSNYKKPLKNIILNSTQFYQILDKIPDKYLNKVPENENEGIHNYFYGYKYCPKPSLNKMNVTYGVRKGIEYMIIRTICLLSYLRDYIPNFKEEEKVIPLYVQCRVECRRNFTEIIQYEQNPTVLFKKFNKIIDKHYTQEEKEECYLSHQLEQDKAKKQIHINVPTNLQKLQYFYIYKFNNCVKYDINGAHCDALCEIFPKAKKDILKLYEKRKEKGNEWIKAMFNMSVGYLNIDKLKKKYGGTYWWIVNRTTELLEKAINYLDGTVIYANTDGVCVQNPKNLMKNSKELGEFKLEYQGDVYYHAALNYFVYQFGDDIKGSCRLIARDYMDLREGIIVNYSLIDNKVTNITKGVLETKCVE